MYKGKGNTKGRETRRTMPTAEQQALFIAESIGRRIAEKRSYSVSEYGIENNVEMIELVARQLGVIR